MNEIPFNVKDADKDALYEYALGKFAVELDKRRKLDDLRKDVESLIETGELPAATTPKKAKEVQTPQYLRHPVSGVVFEYTDYLSKRGDMIPCDADGKNV